MRLRERLSLILECSCHKKDILREAEHLLREKSFYVAFKRKVTAALNLRECEHECIIISEIEKLKRREDLIFQDDLRKLLGVGNKKEIVDRVSDLLKELSRGEDAKS